MSAITGPVLLRIAGFPDPNPQQPPGTQGLLNLVSYVSWGFSLVCVVALIVAAGRLAMSHHRGEPAGMGIVVVMVAAVIGSSAGPILNAVAT